MKIVPKRSVLYAGAGAAAASLVFLGLVFGLASRPALATAQFAKETGKACGACHTAAAGGGPLTPLGVEFQKNGNKLPGTPSKP